MVLHAHCRDAHAKYVNGNQGAIKSILHLRDGNRPEDLSIFNSLTCKNNVTIDYYGVWRTETVCFTHGYVDGDM